MNLSILPKAFIQPFSTLPVLETCPGPSVVLPPPEKSLSQTHKPIKRVVAILDREPKKMNEKEGNPPNPTPQTSVLHLNRDGYWVK